MTEAIDHVDLTPPEAPPNRGLQNAFYASGLGAIIVAVIYFGQPILMPAALAILLAFALAPVVTRLRALGLPRIVSVVVAVLLAFSVIGALGTYIVTEFALLASAFPRYESNLTHKIDALKGAAQSNGVIARASAVLQRLDNDLSVPAQAPGTVAGTKVAPQPVVEMPSRSGSPFAMVRDIVGPLLDPLATTGIVVIFVIFILVQKDDLRDRFIRLAGSRDLRRTTLALDDGAARLSRYLLMQTSINTCFGIMIGTGLWAIGIPNAGLWGLIGMMLRFVPYVGVPVAASIPVALAFAIDPGWSKMGETLLLYLAIEPVLGQVVEPVVYGRSSGLSATAVVVAATFWTWVWGPAGLLLSTPLTMCLVVIGRHVDQLRFLDVLLGDRPALSLEEGLYLRMLGGDPDEAAHQAEVFLEHNSLSAYYDEVAVKALFMAQADARHNALDRDRRLAVRMTMEGLIQNLADHSDDTGPFSPHDAPPPPEMPEDWSQDAVLCIAGPGPLDDTAALLLSDLLSRHGIGAHVVPHTEVLPVNIDAIATQGVRFLAVCYLEPANFTNARYLVRRLKRHFPESRLLLSFLGLGADDTRYHDAVDATGCELVATDLRESVERILYYAKHAGLDAALNRGGALVA
jgi:predicted PurR-regulated permease PerM